MYRQYVHTIALRRDPQNIAAKRFRNFFAFPEPFLIAQRLIYSIVLEYSLKNAISYLTFRRYRA